MKDILNVGVIGAGAISGIYLENMISMFSNIQPVCICANHIEHAKSKAEQFGIRACTLEEMLVDPEVDLCVVLTPVGEHYSIIRQVLLAGKHVYTEKTICQTTDQAKELCELADQKRLYLGSAPDTFLGASIQTARKAIDDGVIGDVNSFSISINRSNDFLAAVFPFLREPGSGVLRDYMVYYLTALISILGPAEKTSAIVRKIYSDRMNSVPETKNYGEIIKTPNESVVTATLTLENGITGVVHLNQETVLFDLAYFNIYGRNGILCLGNSNLFGGEVKILQDPLSLRKNLRQEPIAQFLEPVNMYSSNSRGLGVSEMANSIIQGKRNRASKELALHVLDVIEAMEKSSEKNIVCEINTSCVRPEAFIV